jgi:hypothetical protein
MQSSLFITLEKRRCKGLEIDCRVLPPHTLLCLTKSSDQQLADNELSYIFFLMHGRDLEQVRALFQAYTLHITTQSFQQLVVANGGRLYFSFTANFYSIKNETVWLACSLDGGRPTYCFCNCRSWAACSVWGEFCPSAT